jgi:plasmid stabilization system protein ParE
MRFEFHPEALEEYEESARYYARRQAGLELRFIDCVESAIKQACESPTRWAVFDTDVRRCLVRVFPFAVLYSVEPDYVLIVAVRHLSREPGYWRNRRG